MTEIVGAPPGCPRTDLDLWSNEVLTDPYPTYRALRDLGPVVWLDRYGVAVLPRYAEVHAALSDWQTFSSAGGVAVAESSNRLMGASILTTDPPEHGAYRGVMSAQLSRRALEDAVAGITRQAEAIVDEAVGHRRFDAVGEISRPFSLGVIASMLGLPDDDGRRLLPALAEGAFNLIGPANDRQVSGFESLVRMARYNAGTVEAGTLRSGSRGAQLAADGHAEHLTTYTWPGIDTTVNAMSSALYLFAQHPNQWDLLRSDPSLIPSAWNEVLRLHAPVHAFSRLTTSDTVIDGITLPAETRVVVMYGSANRDERQYPDPDRFDITRNPIEHLAFGRGIHLCVGVHLARIEGHALLHALAQRVDRFRVVAQPQWMINNSIHGLATLPLEVDRMAECNP